MNFMVEQVKSLPGLINEIFLTVDESVRAVLDHELCISIKRIMIAGCGNSHHAALGSELAFETLAGLPTEPMTAHQMARYAAGFIPQTGPLTNLMFGISVSGSVARTGEALRMARQAGAMTVAVTATPGSLVSQQAERNLLVQTPAFPEPEGTHCPGVRTFFANQLALLLAAVRIGEVRGHLTSARASELRAQIRGMSQPLQETIDVCEMPVKELVSVWADAAEFVFIGGGPNYGMALFSAAKLLEASGDSAWGQETEEWCHLQYFAREAGTPTFFITAADRDYSRAVEAAVAAKALGRRVAAVAPMNASELISVADRHLPFVKVPEVFSPLVSIIPGSLFAAYRSDHLGEPYFRAFKGGRDIQGGGGISRIRTSDMWERWHS